MPRGRGGVLNAFYWYQVFAPYSVAVITQKYLVRLEAFLTNAMYHHRKAINSNYCTMKKQRKRLTTHRQSEPKKTSNWATVGPAKDKHQTPTNGWKFYARGVTEAWPTVVQIKEETMIATVVPTKSDSDVIFCLQLLGKTLACTLHLS